VQNNKGKLFLMWVITGHLRQGLGIGRVSTKFFPRLLTQEEGRKKENTLYVDTHTLECSETDKNFSKRAMTGDETAVYG
jgi:hypothetical protein